MTERDAAHALIGHCSGPGREPFHPYPAFAPISSEARPEPDGTVSLISTWSHASVVVHVAPGCSGSDG
jgi:hypothetical protein